MTVTIIVVLELILCAGWISQSNAQLSASLLPQEHQSVCRGESVSYNCIGNGTGMSFFSPPIVNETAPLVLLSSDDVRTCPVIRDSATACLFVDSGGSSAFMGTFNVLISNEQSEGQLSVTCRVSTADGMNVTNSTTLSVLGAPNLETISNFQSSTIAPLSNGEGAAVNISWDSPVNAQEFMLTISNIMNGYMTTIRSLENRVTVSLPYGTYSAKLCVTNRCYKVPVCRDFPSAFLVERQSDPARATDVDPALLALAVIAGVLGLLLILAVIYGVVITIKWYMMKK